MSTQAIQTRDPEKAIEFIPFGSADKIRLSVKIIQNMVAVPTRSGKTCTERDALRFLMLCQAQRLNPFAGDAFLVGYDSQDGPTFSLITAHQAFLKRAETCPDFEGMESGIIIMGGDEDSPTITEREGDFHLETENVVGGWARVHRKGRRDTYRRIRMSRFNKGFAQWKADPAGMIVKCAEADALRSTFPTLLGGLYMQGEADGAAGRIVAEIATTRPIFEVPNRIEDKPAQGRTPETKFTDEGEGTDLGPQKSHAPTGTGAAAAQSEPERKVQSAAQEPPPAPATEDKDATVRRVVKALKGLLSVTGHGEVDLMRFLVATKGCDDSLGNLPELGKVAPEFLAEVHDNWAAIEKELRAWKEGQAK